MQKIIIYISFIALAFSSCEKKIDGFLIKGKIKVFEDQTLIVKNTLTQKEDKIEVKNGKFKYACKVEEPTKYYLATKGWKSYTGIFVENTKFKITGSGDDLSKWTIEGGEIQQEYAALKAKKKELTKKFNIEALNEKYKKAKEAKDEKLLEELYAKYEKFYKKKAEFCADYIQKHPTSYVAGSLIKNAIVGKDPLEAEKVVNYLAPALHKYKPVKGVLANIAKRKTVMVGKTIPDFTMNDINGKPVKLSDLYPKSKYLLVDFWASWCAPCRQENPVLVKAYKKYRWRGFNILGVSLDKDKDKWQKAIAKDKLTWKHVSDLKGWENSAAAMYGVEGIPTNFLVDRKGKIVASKLRGEDLEKKLKELLPYRRRRR